MKMFVNRYTIILGIVFSVAGCKPDLDLDNPKELGISTYYTSVDQLKAAIIPAYQALVGKVQGQYGRCFYYNLLAPGDDFNHTFKWQPMYMDTYDTPSNNGEITASWKDLFNGVFAANVAIDRIHAFTGTIDASLKDQLLGEAHFLRGLHYMHLGAMFGETVPLIISPVKSSDEYYPANANPGEVYALIVRDFQEASDRLPAKSVMYADPANIGRATQGAALGYLAKAYLYRPILEKGKPAEFDNAAIALQKVIDSNEYGLMDNFRDNFLDGKENNKESLFEVQMVNGPSWLGGDLSVSWRWQEIGMYDGTGGSWWNLAPNQKVLNEFETTDPRKFMTLWCEDGAHYTEGNGNVTDWDYWMDHLATDKDLLGTRKYCRDYQVADIDNDINDRLLRYADVLLMYAECLHEAGNVEDAKTYIDMVRSRANNIVPTEQPHLWYQHSPGTIPDVDGLLAQGIAINGVEMNNVKNILQHERFVELCGEYVRYFDLLRWGMADPAWLAPLQAQGWTEKAMYYPFPQTELDNNKKLTGNDMNNK